MRGLLRFDETDDKLTLKSTGKQPEGGFAALPAGERAIARWVEAPGGSAKIDSANGTAWPRSAQDFTTNIEKETRNRFFRRNFGYVVAGVAMTVLVVVG